MIITENTKKLQEVFDNLEKCYVENKIGTLTKAHKILDSFIADENNKSILDIGINRVVLELYINELLENKEKIFDNDINCSRELMYALERVKLLEQKGNSYADAIEVDTDFYREIDTLYNIQYSEVKIENPNIALEECRSKALLKTMIILDNLGLKYADVTYRADIRVGMGLHYIFKTYSDINIMARTV